MNPVATLRGEHETRVEALRERLAAEDLAALIVLDHLNIRYLTGFMGSAGVVVVLPEEMVLLSDFRYRTQAREQSAQVRFIEVEGEVSDLLGTVLTEVDGRVGVEKDHLTVSQWERFEPKLRPKETILVAGLVQDLRRVKSVEEIRAISEASRLTVAVMERVREIGVVGRSERDVALDLEMWARRQGSDVVPFAYIVAWGPNGAKPHAVAGDAIIGDRGLLVVDIGTTIDGYASDMTRTFATGEVGSECRRAFDVTLEAQEAARGCAGPGVRCSEVDRVARGVIEAHGLGDRFKHGLGHGVGLDVHEAPTLSQRSEDVLTQGMVVTIEPGVYLEGACGVRIEDTVVVTDAGIEVLTAYERGFTIVA